MDYCLNAGDGTASWWTGQLDIDIDGDGELDGVRLDIDGDGEFDDALFDGDGDGAADEAALDIGGAAEVRLTDDGSGTWALTGGMPARPLRWFGLDGAEHNESGDPDVNADGQTDLLVDIDRDGLADRALLGGGGAGIGYVDTDADGRWDLMLADTNADGRADAAGEL